MLDDGYGRAIELVHELPGSVQVDQVVVAKFFALQLLRARHPGAAAVPIKRRSLVRIFPVTQIGLLGIRNQQRRWERTPAGRRRSGIRLGVGCDLIEGPGDCRVVR